MSKDSKGILITLLAALLFGMFPSCARLFYADGGNQITFIIVTTFSRMFFLVSAAVLQGGKFFPSRSDTKEALKGGLCQALSATGVLTAMLYLPGAVVMCILFTHTLMLLLLYVIKKEIPLTFHILICTCAALLSLTVILDVWNTETHFSLIGFTFAFGAAAVTVFRMYVYQQQTKKREPMIVGAENFIFSLLFTLLLLMYESPVMPEHSMSYVYLLIASVSMGIGTICMFYGISLLGSFKFSLLVKIEPLFTLIYGVILAKEYLKFSQTLGVVGLVASLMAFQWFEMNKKQKKI